MLASARRVSIRLFRTIGYLSCSLQWLWIIMLLLPLFLQSSAGEFFLPAPQPVEAPSLRQTAQPGLGMLLLAGLVTVIMVVVSLVILLRLPSSIRTRGERLTEHTTDLIVPVLTHHKPLPKKRQRRLSARVAIYVKLSLVLTPFVIALFTPAAEAISRLLIVFIAAGLAVISLVAFAAEQGLSFAGTASKKRAYSKK